MYRERVPGGGAHAPSPERQMLRRYGEDTPEAPPHPPIPAASIGVTKDEVPYLLASWGTFLTCHSRLLISLPAPRQHGLPQREAAVVRRHPLMHEDLEARLVEFVDRHLHKQRVLKHAAGQPDGLVDPCSP